MRNVIYSCLSKSDPYYVDYLRIFEEEADNYKKQFKIDGVLSDVERKFMDFIIKSYEVSGETPSLDLFVKMFSEYPVEDDLRIAEEIGINDFRVYIFNLIDKRVNKYIANRLDELNAKVKSDGITDDIAQEFTKLTSLSNRNKAKDINIEIDSKQEYDNKKLRPVGLVTGIPEIDDKIGGMSPGTVTTIAGFTSQYKCVSENERVYTNRGLLTMKEIYNIGVHSDLMVQSEFGMRKLVAVHDEGIKNSYIVYIGGIPIETSPVHRFRVLTDNGLEWVEAQNLKCGDRIVQSLKESTHDGLHDSSRFWRLMGQLYGDGGCINANSLISSGNTIFLCGALENLKFMDSESLFDEFFSNYYLTISEPRKVGYKKQFMLRASLNNAFRLELSKFVGKNSKTKVFPVELFSKDISCWKSFILGLYETDGCCGTNLGFTMSNKSFLLGVSRLLSAMGISSCLYEVKSSDSYHLAISGNRSKNRFNDIISSCETKVSGVKYLDESKDSSKGFPTRDEFVAHRLTYTRDDYKFFGSFTHKDRLTSFDKIKKVCENYDEFRHSEYFNEILDAELTWNTVTDIEQSECYMYDLTVEGSPTYCLNGYVTHNTTMSLNIAHLNAYELGYNICYLSLETPKEDINWNLLSCHSYSTKFQRYNFVSHAKMRWGTMTADEEDFIFNEVEPDLKNDYIDDEGNTRKRGKVIILDESDFKTFSFGEISSVIEKVDDKLGGKLDCVIVDYIQLCKFSGQGVTYDANSQINSYVTFFRRLAQNFKKEIKEDGTEEVRQLTMILLAQINRSSWQKASRNDGRYDITCLADANELERGSARVFTTYTSEDLKARKSAQVQILKNRAGQTMYDPVTVYADGEAYVFMSEDGMNSSFGGDGLASVESAFASMDDSFDFL